MKPVEELLRETIGLDAASIGSSLIQRAVRLRMKQAGIRNMEDYGVLLENDARERGELIESVIVAETWFFRDREPFAALARLVIKEWLPKHPTGPLRLLSLPCSSGEEPYSMVMTLLENGVPAERFHLDAVDISARALMRARTGIYGKNSFRGSDLAFRTRHFQPVKEGFALNPTVRDCVHFRHGNLLEEGFLQGRSNYDFIFCRNLLIYFDRATQKKALSRLGDLLAPSGLLFVGPAEQTLALNEGFVSATIPMAFACRKSGQSGLARGTKYSPGSGTFPHGAVTAAQVASTQVKPGSRCQAHVFQVDLEAARRLADAGQLRQAAEMCEIHLRLHGTSAQAYYLLGLIGEAGGEREAVDCYRKALYLDPNHYETLLQLALLADKGGEKARAGTLRSRAQRVQRKTALQAGDAIPPSGALRLAALNTKPEPPESL